MMYSLNAAKTGRDAGKGGSMSTPQTALLRKAKKISRLPSSPAPADFPSVVLTCPLCSQPISLKGHGPTPSCGE
ncbi:hypothetical protein Plhal304r1_c004g0017361 [Plasmopara halstedii]